jgi:arylsulfatase
VRAKEGAPNVLFIVLDDTGYGHLGCYGGLIDTPNLDKLAANGLLYSSMHTTALCSPTRACILTGRNHHSNNMACITEGSTGFPGYTGDIPFENGFLSEILLQQGYNTYCLGKWHLTPSEQVSAAGPYDRWPVGRGFERYYGFLGGDTHQFYPDLVYDHHQIEPPKTPEEGYHLTEDLADRAIAFIADAKQVAPDKPFFMYWATGAMHAPHHVPKEWADKYKGKFDMGWEKAREIIHKRQLEKGIIPAGTQLSRHDPDVPKWDTLSDDERRLYARMMEVFAGFLEHTDHHIGRMIDFLEEMGELDNTIIMVISDNGSSAEGGATGSVNECKFFNFVPESLEDNLAAIDDLGGPKYFNHFPWGWTWAGNTPFRRWKRETYRGGTSDPFLVHWPKGIKAKGEVRTQYAHAIDMVPTVLEALGVEPPTEIKGVTQSPIEGYSFAHTFDSAKAEGKHITQYFEMMGHRSLYHDGWRAVCPWPGPSFAEAGKGFGVAPLPAELLTEMDANNWELYNVAEDFAENDDLAADNRARLIEMVGQWYVEAGKYHVLPIDGRGQQRFADPRPQLTADRTRYVYYPGTQSVPPHHDHPQPPPQHQRQCDHPARRRRGRARLARRGGGRLHALREGQEAALRLQLRGRGAVPRRVHGRGAGGRGRARLRARAHRQARRPRRQGRARPRAALHQQEARRAGRRPAHHAPAHHARRRHHGGAQGGLAHHARLHAAVRVHRHAPSGRLRCQRRVDQGRRGHHAPGHGAAVGPR